MKIILFVFCVAMAASCAYGAGGTPAITNRPIGSVSSTEAVVEGYLISTGNAPTTVFVYWGESDGAWSGTNDLGLYSWGTNDYPYSYISGLTPLTTYYYTYAATNANGISVASPSESFTTLDSGAGGAGGGGGGGVGDPGMAYIYGTNETGISIIEGSPFIGPNYSTNSLFWYYRTNALVWYAFGSTNAQYVVDYSTNGNHGSYYPNSLTFYTNDGYRISSIYENYVFSKTKGIGESFPEITVAMWVKPLSRMKSLAHLFGNSLYTNKYEFTVDPAKQNDLNSPGIRSFIMQTNQLSLYFSESTNGNLLYINKITAPSIDVLPTNSWTRVVASYKKTAAYGSTGMLMYMWVNGVKFQTTGINFIPDVNYWLLGGSLYLIAQWPDMIIDDFIVLPYCFTDAQATADFNAGRSGTLVW